MKITFLGDIMIDNATAKTLSMYYTNTKFDFDSMFKFVNPLLNESDYVFANLETPISFDNSDLTSEQWQFCSPREFAEAVKRMGVDFVSTANNHCLDRGLEGLKSTLRVLDEIKLNHTGTYYSTDEKKSCVVSVKDYNIGCLAYTYGTNAITNHNYLGKKNRKMIDLTQEQEGYIEKVDPFYSFVKRRPQGIVARVRTQLYRLLFPENDGKEWYEKRTIDWYRKHLLKKDIRKLRKKTDFIVFLLHIGGQYNKEPNEYTLKMVEWLLKKKIDIVIANHEHVIHNHKFISSTNQFAAYAIGNFIGGAGTIRPPYDKKSEYSVAVHFYYEEKKLKKITFSVLKTVVDPQGKLSVFPVIDLLDNVEDKSELISEALMVASVFFNKKYDKVEKEFTLYG